MPIKLPFSVPCEIRGKGAPTVPVGEMVREGVLVGVLVSVGVAELLPVMDEERVADGVADGVGLMEAVPVKRQCKS